MKVVVISTSLRPGSNSHAMAEQFAEGAKAAGHEVELISLHVKFKAHRLVSPCTVGSESLAVDFQ